MTPDRIQAVFDALHLGTPAERQVFLEPTLPTIPPPRRYTITIVPTRHTGRPTDQPKG